MKSLVKQQGFLVACTFALAVLGGCSDGGSGSSPAATSLSGKVVKGPVSGSTVCAYALTNGQKAASPLVPCVTTAADGSYTLSQIASYSGDMLIEATGGTYTDEATKATSSLTSTLSTVLPAGGSVTGMITPLTAAAVSRSSSGLTSTAVANAASILANQLGLGAFDILTAAPSFATNGTTATNAYASALGAVAQYMQSNNAALTAAIAALGTSSNQAAYQAALNSYISSNNVASSATPTSFNFSINTPATATSSGTTSAGGTAPGGSLTGSGGLVGSSTLSVTGSLPFTPLTGVGITTGTGSSAITVVTFTGFSGTSIQGLGVSVTNNGDIDVSYTESANAIAKDWEFDCVKAACNGRVSVNVASKTVTFTNLSLAPVAPHATGNIVINGSVSYQ